MRLRPCINAGFTSFDPKTLVVKQAIKKYIFHILHFHLCLYLTLTQIFTCYPILLREMRRCPPLCFIPVFHRGRRSVQACVVNRRWREIWAAEQSFFVWFRALKNTQRKIATADFLFLIKVESTPQWHFFILMQMGLLHLLFPFWVSALF